jgi:oligopeptide/dipeptide ABC transporter ATP-binding protein
MPPLIETRNLKKYFETPRGMLHAVDDVSVSIDKGKTLGVVGESGCGKSTLGRTMIHLLESTGGSIIFEGEDVTVAKGRKLRRLRENMQFIFQDPFSSLNPRMTVQQTIMEPLTISGRYSRKERLAETERIMDMVGVDKRIRVAYPHELDGGRRQRVGIGRALALQPKLVVCDEPVSALDVSISAQVLNLLQDLQDEQGLTYVFVTHDLSVVRHISDDICVMYLGQIVETTSAAELFERPLHPYTKALLSAIPSTDIHQEKRRILLQGEIVSPINPKPGCRFAARCSYARPECQEQQNLEEVLPDHSVLCRRARDINGL